MMQLLAATTVCWHQVLSAVLVITTNVVLLLVHTKLPTQCALDASMLHPTTEVTVTRVLATPAT